jgi:hypothetical protein
MMEVGRDLSSMLPGDDGGGEVLVLAVTWR